VGVAGQFARNPLVTPEAWGQIESYGRRASIVGSKDRYQCSRHSRPPQVLQAPLRMLSMSGQTPHWHPHPAVPESHIAIRGALFASSSISIQRVSTWHYLQCSPSLRSDNHASSWSTLLRHAQSALSSCNDHNGRGKDLTNTIAPLSSHTHYKLPLIDTGRYQSTCPQYQSAIWKKPRAGYPCGLSCLVRASAPTAQTSGQMRRGLRILLQDTEEVEVTRGEWNLLP